MQTQVLGLSVDSVDCLVAWAKSLGGISYPLISDFYPHGATAESFGVLLEDGRSARAIFVIDKAGVVQYVDVHDIDDQPDNEEVFAVLARLEPEAAATIAAADATKPKVQPASDVVLYCTPWCPSCKLARQFLENQGVEFTEINISRDREAAAQVRAWADGNETTPTFNIRGTVVVNYDRARLLEIFGS